MTSSSFEKKLIERIEPHLVMSTPGVQVQVFHQGRKLCDISVGETYPYYDFASLTKIIFTVPAMMKAFEAGMWSIQTLISDILPWYPHKNVLIKDLLTHTSGLAWWLPLYKDLDLNTSSLNRWTEGSRLIRSVKLNEQVTAVYSDLGFILLGHLLEKMYSLPLYELWVRLKDDIYPKSTFNFHIENRPSQQIKYYAPTERCAWRNKILQGEVHDENAWSFGGVSTHAGLFGSIDDLSWFGTFLRSEMRGLSKSKFKAKTMKAFTSRAISPEAGDWTLGFMMPTKGSSSSGKYFSAASVGHTGFTGTSFWYDPVNDVAVAMLSNRIVLGREPNNFSKLRPQIHDWIIEGLRRV